MSRTVNAAAFGEPGAVGPESLVDLLEDSVRRWPERPLLLGDSGETLYRDFLAGVNGLSGLLAEGGVRRGDRVAAALHNGPELLYLWLALARLGAVLVPINPALRFPEVEPLLRQAEVRDLVSDAETLAIYGAHLSLRLRMVVGEEPPPGAMPFATPPVLESPFSAAVGADLSTILQTSGTTGRAKGAALTQASYSLPAREFVRWMEIVPEDRFLACLPLFHMAGQAFAASAIAGGASLLLVPRFSGHEFWSQIRRHRITIVRHLGEMLAVLLQQPESREDRQHSLRAAYGGGARPELAEDFEARFGAVVVEGYGLTETNTVLRNEIGARRRGSIGRPLPYGEVRIAVAEPGQRAPGGRQIGEIQIRQNPVLMTGYVGEPELAQSCFVDGWFRTGDLGYCDEDGYFYFVGREKDIIRRRGENIVPAHIEEILCRHPAVACAAVVGVPDEVGGEEIKAYLIPRPGGAIDLRELIEWCREWLADFQIPRYLELCADLPRTSTNKLNRGEIRKMALAGSLGFDRKAHVEP
jgi:acyl-CoA synthetase (AMP-forming)/AMP-acid ligase II